eukprot:TRINITY_DN12162_c0_g1_i3.p1 TRINITY_DN12162_c0_g1~~TRINITY_DN12162_c0_g1_i3.p1  ORF type:complete len:157 (-),score=12.53 TRINITY_DN12162_c0_g1_i3:156-626(-)
MFDMAFLKRFFDVIDLGSSDDEQPGAPVQKCQRTGSIVHADAEEFGKNRPLCDPATGGNPTKSDLIPTPSQSQSSASRSSAPARPAIDSVDYYGPIYMNRLLPEVAPQVAATGKSRELSLQDIFEDHPSRDGSPPLEVLLANFMIDRAWRLAWTSN